MNVCIMPAYDFISIICIQTNMLHRFYMVLGIAMASIMATIEPMWGQLKLKKAS